VGLKQDIIDAKLAALKKDAELSGAKKEDINSIKASESIELEAELMTKAISNLLTNAKFTITKFNAPIKLENLKTPDQPVNVGLETMMGEYGPLLTKLNELASIVPGGSDLIGALETEIENAIRPLLEGGSTLPGMDLSKDDGALDGTGYCVIGEDPESQGSFDVEDIDGQRTFTEVRLDPEDMEDLV
tara:strand:+ start:135 stop:698 length:564 start_codon:yes stop_codon:yes gene_type:complete